jgi:hypothetical protein
VVGTGEVTDSSNTAKQRFADISPNCASKAKSMTPSGRLQLNRHVVGLLHAVRRKVKMCQNSNKQPRQQARQPRLQIEERSERIDPPFAPSV